MATLQFLDAEVMHSVETESFRAIRPYPWSNPLNFVRPEQMRKLIADLPPQEQFRERFDYARKHGQESHNRFVLDYTDELSLAPSWHAFVEELRGDTYREFVCRLLDVRQVRFSFQWHYTPRGASVSPHVDSRRKIGSHIFYLNPDTEWRPEWGGQTLVLDDHGEFHRDSNPDVDSFHACQVSSNAENRSLIFGRGKKSWHAVRALECPEGVLRKIFIVRYEKHQPVKQWRKQIKMRFTGKGELAAADRYLY